MSELQQQAMIDISLMDDSTRQQLGGAALRTFVNIAKKWNLSEKERLIVLGSLARSTYHAWVSKAQDDQSPNLPLDVLLRISAILGIYKALKIIFHSPEQGLEWLNAPNTGRTFGGQSPKDILLCGTQDGLMLVRRYLDAWRGGVFSQPAGENNSSINENDIIIIDKD